MAQKAPKTSRTATNEKGVQHPASQRQPINVFYLVDSQIIQGNNIVGNGSNVAGVNNGTQAHSGAELQLLVAAVNELAAAVKALQTTIEEDAQRRAACQGVPPVR